VLGHGARDERLRLLRPAGRDHVHHPLRALVGAAFVDVQRPVGDGHQDGEGEAHRDPRAQGKAQAG
jgi:hypothetical protein